MMKLIQALFFVGGLLWASVVMAQTTGRIDGTVIDAGSGDPLPGVNVVIVGTQQGAVTNAEGYYTVVGVRAGSYSLRASFIGYTDETVEDVRVNVGLTTTINFSLQDEAVGLDEVFVIAERPIVQRDISANVANLTAEDIETLPVMSVEGVVGLQAGIEPGLQIRGGGLDQAAIVIDGMSMTDGRTATPFTGVSYTSVSEIQVQTGGFTAEYGDLRSGLINIVTKEGHRDRYSADVLVRYSSPTQKYFGNVPNYADDAAGEYAYWMGAFLDPDVADIGTHSDNSPWDRWTRRANPQFRGWRQVVRELEEDRGIQTNEGQLREVYRWITRQDFSPRHPDYEIDASIGGPLPGGQALGNLRFLASYRQTQRAYAMPMVRTFFADHLGQLKFNADIGRGSRLMVQGMYAEDRGVNHSGEGHPWSFDRGEMQPFPWSGDGNFQLNRIGRDPLFSNAVWMPSDVTRLMLGGEFTQMINDNTFYNVRLQRMQSDYETTAPPRRDTSVINTVGPFRLNEAPLGWTHIGEDDPIGSGMRYGGHWGLGRDFSTVTRWTGAFDITSQVNRYMQVKSGLEYIYSDYDVYNARHDSFFVHHANPIYDWRRQPQQAGAFGQTKLEFQGMVANLGLRLDYFHAGGDWWVIDDPYHRALSPRFGAQNLAEGGLTQGPTERKLYASPRIGISFPITDNSKLFFNYGHMRQMPNPHDLFMIEEINTGAVGAIGNPNFPLAQTVSYEVGYEHNLFDQFLLRVGGYYNDMRNQIRSVRYTSIDGQVNYTTRQPLNYGDVRGLEFTLTKTRGEFVRGFANFTYLARKGGNFGFGTYYQNRVQQRLYELTTTDHYQSRPVPEPFSHFNIEFRVPRDFGPGAGDFHPLGNWRLNLLGQWRAGQVFTWTGGDFTPQRDLQHNVRYRDYWMFDMRLSRTLNVAGGNINLFADFNNVLNLRQLRWNSFSSGDNQRDYMLSLHLPADAFEALDTDPYLFVPGNDRPGDFRRYEIGFVPIIVVASQGALPETGESRRQGHRLPDNSFLGPLYYLHDSGQYMVWNGSGYQAAEQSHVDWVLKHKAYIDMPWESYRAFMEPRNVFFGIRVNL